MVSIANMASPSRPRFSVSVALLTLLFCSSSSGQDALQHFHKMQSALGGADKIAEVQDFEQSVRAETWDNQGNPHGLVRKRTRWVRPNYLRLDRVGPDDTYLLYFDGAKGWEILPDKTVSDLVGGELKFAQNYIRDFNLNLWLADRDPHNVITSSAPHVLAIADKGPRSGKLEITLNPVTSLPVKQTTLSLADPNNPVPSETRFDKWETVGGVRFAGTISIFQNGKKLAEITVEQTKVNSGIKPSDLAIKPTNLSPVMSQP
jgi:hypothetical protein